MADTERSYKMDDSTKRWLTSDLSSSDKESALKQVAEAEAQKKISYQIQVSNGWFDIENGIIRGSGKSGK